MSSNKLKRSKSNSSSYQRHSTDNESYASDGNCRDDTKCKVKKEDHNAKKRKRENKGDDVWEWWKEDSNPTGIKWTFLEHNGPLFAPKYERLPASVKFYYNGKLVPLTDATQEVAGFYARMLGHEYTKKSTFNDNFMREWQSFMSDDERAVIVDLSKCDFGEMCQHYKAVAEVSKNVSKEEKHVLAQARERVTAEYGFCTIDGHKQKIGNFKMEPPGLFRGRGDHPKMGCVKRRVWPEDVVVNCSRDSRFPRPPVGHQWKEVRHDSSVCWLACWVDHVQQSSKYVLLNVCSRVRGERDWRKYEVARGLHSLIDGLRHEYLSDMQSKEMYVRQRAVALYFIDKLALRAGNEKGDDEADTVGCCSLRVEHVRLTERKDGPATVYEIELDFLGKDSIRYQNCMPVLKRVYKNVARFMEAKEPSDSLFDRLNTSSLNQFLKDIMNGLTAKVFRTYNASRILEEQLEIFTKVEDSVENKVLSYNRANRAVAILCNHQRSAPKSFEKSMEKLDIKIKEKKVKIEEIKKDARKIKKQYRKCKDSSQRNYYEKLGKKLLKLQEQLSFLESSSVNRNENKEVALGTSKLNYLDPRISVAWCARYGVPIAKIYNKSQLQKFRWAVDITSSSFVFCDMDSDASANRVRGFESGSGPESELEDSDP